MAETFEQRLAAALREFYPDVPDGRLREQAAELDAEYRRRQRANLSADAIDQATEDFLHHRDPPGRCPCGVDGCVLRRDAERLLTAAGVNPDLWRGAGQEPRQSP
jgi:hypothetical protein